MSLFPKNIMSMLIGSMLLAAVVAVSSKEPMAREVRVFESSTQTLTQTEALIHEEDVYLKTAFLEKAFGLVRKELSEEMVGICLEELCIPFSKSTGSHRLRYEGDTEYVPIRQLISALQGTAIWEPNSGDLLLNLRPRAADENGLSAPSEFILNDMDGRPVSLSDFKGKKVALFAWASW